MAEDKEGGEGSQEPPAGNEKTIQSLPVWKPPPPVEKEEEELSTRQLAAIPPATPATPATPAAPEPEPELPTQNALPVVPAAELPTQTTLPVAPAVPEPEPVQQGWTPPQRPEPPPPMEVAAPEPLPPPPPVEAAASEPPPPPAPPVEAAAPEPPPPPPPAPPAEAVAPEPSAPPAPPVEAAAPEPPPPPPPVQAAAPQPQPSPAPEPAKPDHGWAVVEAAEEKPMVPVKGPDPDLRVYAEWFTWMKTGGAQVPVCHLGAQAAVQAAKTTSDVNQIVQAVHLAVSTGATAAAVDPRHQAYCGFYALGAIDFKLESPKAHDFADAAAEVIEKGGNIQQATAAARAAAGLPA